MGGPRRRREDFQRRRAGVRRLPAGRPRFCLLPSDYLPGSGLERGNDLVHLVVDGIEVARLHRRVIRDVRIKQCHIGNGRGFGRELRLQRRDLRRLRVHLRLQRRQRIRPRRDVRRRPALNRNSDAGEHARRGRRWPRPRGQPFARVAGTNAETFRCARVFRAGAENCARGGRAPVSLSDFGLNRSRDGINASFLATCTRPRPPLPAPIQPLLKGNFPLNSCNFPLLRCKIRNNWRSQWQKNAKLADGFLPFPVSSYDT